MICFFFFFLQAEDGIRDFHVTGVQTCALPIYAVVASDGPQRAQFLLERVVGHAQLTGAAPAPAGTTPYLNTIPPQNEPAYPVDEQLERRVRSIVRWNAIATILNANKTSSELGGHIASYQSAAVLYET